MGTTGSATVSRLEAPAAGIPGEGRRQAGRRWR